MKKKNLTILLADDDADDCFLFKEALEELPVSAQLTTVNNGEQLMHLLNNNEPTHDILFLDLNMPRKNGFDCLAEIRQNKKLNDMAIVTISTSFEADTVSLLYKSGAQHYIRKPNEFTQLKRLIQNAITLTSNKVFTPVLQENFVLSEEV